jgi:RimJ/RimL family protein N-acetyltransferase
MIRRAEPRDLGFLLELLNHPEIEPFLGAGATRERAALTAEIERSRREPHLVGRFVIEADGEAAGTCRFECANDRSRIARLGDLAVHPRYRGRRLADEAAQWLQRHLVVDLGYHRLELEIYGFNERAQRHAERAGFAREGVKRRAYVRHGDWADGILYGLVREDLDLTPSELLRSYVAAHNAGVRTGAWDQLGTFFADDAELVFEGPPIGPFRGREAIVAAYRERPPDDTVELLDIEESESGVTAGYAWSADRGTLAGELRLEQRDRLITRLVVGV